MWKRHGVLWLLLCLSCCSPPLAFTQSGAEANWDDFDQIISDLQQEILNLKQERQNALDSLTLSEQERATLIVDYETRLQSKDRELSDWKQKYELLKSGAAVTESLKNRLSRRLTVSILINIGQGIALLGSLVGVGYLLGR